MSRLANIFASDRALYIEVPAGYGDYIELRTGSDLLELLRDLIAAGNAHFGTTARLIEISGEVKAAPFLSDADFPAVAPSPDYAWAEYQAANKQALDEIAAFVGGKR